ncbi:MAG: HAD-IA family hydrolase [Patescibacteria group bacterium]|nr:HAD-IA family hydrolase [Patescibacteria group bacterium]
MAGSISCRKKTTLNNTRTVLFDFDGTIADTLSYGVSLFNEIRSAQGKKIIQPQEIGEYRSLPYAKVMTMLGVSWIELPGLLLQLRNRLHENMAKIRPYNGMLEVLASLHNAGIEIGILTSNSRKNVELFLSNNSIQTVSSVISLPSLFGKDHALRLFMRERHLKQSEVIYIGDELRDIAAARKAGIRVIAVTWGLHSRQLLARGNPFLIADTPGQLRTHLIP